MTETPKRVIFTMGGKGGVGKTGVVVTLAEWFATHQIPVTLLDLDTENKARGSLKHFFDGTVTKVNIHTPAGLDAFIDYLDGEVPIILADMGAGAGRGCRRLVRRHARERERSRRLLHGRWRRYAGPGQRREYPRLGQSPAGASGICRGRKRQRALRLHLLAVDEAGDSVS